MAHEGRRKARTALSWLFGYPGRPDCKAALCVACVAPFAEEYDAAQERGEVKSKGGDTSGVEYANTASAADLGIRRDEIHVALSVSGGALYRVYRGLV